MSYNFDFNDRMLERSDARGNNSYVRPTAPALPSQPYVAPATTPVMMDTAVMPTGMPTEDEITAVLAKLGINIPATTPAMMTAAPEAELSQSEYIDSLPIGSPERLAAIKKMYARPDVLGIKAGLERDVATREKTQEEADAILELNSAWMSDPNFVPDGNAATGEGYTQEELDAAAIRAAQASESGVDLTAFPTEEQVQTALDAAVGNGQPTTDETVLDEYEDLQFGTALMSYYYNPATGETYESTGSADLPPEGFILMDENYTPGAGTGDGTETTEPDFMTELEAMIAAMQAEGTASAEAEAAAQAAAEAELNKTSQNYVVGGSAMGYNPYMSGQYQSNPYGNAGVPDMGGITSIPVPAPLQNFEQPQDQPTAMETFNAGYQSPRTTTSI